jgi:hypothetical protein
MEGKLRFRYNTLNNAVVINQDFHLLGNISVVDDELVFYPSSTINYFDASELRQIADFCEKQGEE